MMQEDHTSSSDAMRKVPVNDINSVIVQRQAYPRDAMIFSRLATQTIFGQGCNKQILVLTFLIISWLPLSCKCTFTWEITPAFQIIYLFMHLCAGKLSSYDFKVKLLSGSVQYIEKAWVIWKSFVISFLFCMRKYYNNNLDEDDLSHCKEKNLFLFFHVYEFMPGSSLKKVVEIGT